ncbi:uncharacterized protein LOC119575847 [Penaeus monodon]|uniref:uncharacterized protein LOC119575847 n=1 Tax=Penaeus monodon TaxID=6687 RepID=UPI0018A72B34|nr:uncharacterized protein LOC119575847 [Penaeus monodon]
MTGRGRALTEFMRRRKVDIMCVQETRWSGNKSEELGDGYKLIYGSTNLDKRNGVGITVSEKFKSTVVEVAEDERCVIGGDLNGHVGRGSDVISRVHGGMCYGEGNEDGERVIDFAICNDMVISNIIFTKRQEHLITYKSSGRASQIDYLLYRRRNMVEMITVRLKDQKKKEEFKERVLEQISQEIEDLNSWWNETADFAIHAGKEILGETSGKIWKDKETWWFNDENKEAKRAVAIAKSRAYDELYEDLDSKEGQGKVFQLAKTRNKSTKDIVHIKQMNENGNIIRTEQGNIKRWEQYFSKSLNEENERLIRGDGDANQGAVLEVSRIEVQQALKKMENGKATGPDGIPMEAWKRWERKALTCYGC